MLVMGHFALPEIPVAPQLAGGKADFEQPGCRNHPKAVAIVTV